MNPDSYREQRLKPACLPAGKHFVLLDNLFIPLTPIPADEAIVIFRLRLSLSNFIHAKVKSLLFRLSEGGLKKRNPAFWAGIFVVR